MFNKKKKKKKGGTIHVHRRTIIIGLERTKACGITNPVLLTYWYKYENSGVFLRVRVKQKGSFCLISQRLI